MKDMEKAAALIEEKIREKRPMRIVGDYDIDGVCSSYILLKGFRQLGAVVDVQVRTTSKMATASTSPSSARQRRTASTRL